MKKVIRLTESDLVRIVKRVIREQEGGLDPQDPSTHFDTVIKALTPKGFKKDTSMTKSMGVIQLTKGDVDSHKGILVRYNSPMHQLSNKKNVVELIVNNKLVKSWSPSNANMYDVIKSVEKYFNRVVSEQLLGDKPSFDKNWLKTLSGLKNFNNPKVINFKYEGEPVTSLNWGIHSDQGRKKNWGLSLSSDNSLSFQTKDEIQSKVFQTVMGLKPEFNSLSKSYSYNGDIDFSNSSELISKIKKIILSLG